MDVMDFVSKFAEALAVSLLPLLVGFVVAYLKVLIDKKLAEIKEAYPDAYWTVSRIAEMVVAAAEQAGAAGIIDEKKKYAMDMATKWLAQYDLDIDVALIEAAIEAEVKKQFNTDHGPGATYTLNAYPE